MKKKSVPEVIEVTQPSTWSVEMDRVVFGDMLRRLRQEKKWTQKNLATTADIDQALVSALERGVKGAGPVTAEKLVNALLLQGDQRADFLYWARRSVWRGGVPRSLEPAARPILQFLLGKLSGEIDVDIIADMSIDGDTLLVKLDGGEIYSFAINLKQAH